MVKQQNGIQQIQWIRITGNSATKLSTVARDKQTRQIQVHPTV